MQRRHGHQPADVQAVVAQQPKMVAARFPQLLIMEDEQDLQPAECEQKDREQPARGLHGRLDPTGGFA